MRNLPRLPKLAPAIGSRIPLAPVIPLVEALLNRVFARALEEGDLEFLRDRELVIEVEDAGQTIGFRFDGGRLRCRRATAGDVHIAGSAAAFVLLASGKADADTLFFQRLLVMSGDTATGLSVKYLLEATSTSDLPSPLRRILDFTGTRLAAQLANCDDMPAVPRQ